MSIAFIGAGPSTINAVTYLIEKGYNKSIDIVIFEKGKSLSSRQPTEVINGWGGGGTFSDGKLSSALEVGGVIPGLTQQELSDFEGIYLNTLNKFNDGEELNWNKTTNYDTSSSSLSWLSHNTCHMGTERSRSIFKKLEDYIASQPNIKILFESEVLGAFKLTDYLYQIVYRDSKGAHYIVVSKVIVATGQKSTLPAEIMDYYNLMSTPRAFQLGVRVEDEINPQYENIIKANYDFKFVKEYKYDNVTCRLRTFCCNSGNAHTCEEVAKEGFSCFNGHAFKTKDESNHSVNYGIMCEIEGLDTFGSKKNQIELMKNINSIPTWKEDNFENGEVKPKRRLLDGFEHLRGYYPDEVIKSLEDFTQELNKLVDLSKAHYLYPEVKLSGYIPNIDFNTYESKEIEGLYFIGDAVISRGILKSAFTGYKFAKGLVG